MLPRFYNCKDVILVIWNNNEYIIKKWWKFLSIILIVSCSILFTTNVKAEIKTSVNADSSFKSYMSYKAITKKDSPQYKLQECCTTDNDGFRKIYDLYVIAVGTGVGGRVGSFIDITLDNGIVISGIIGDYKNKSHTDSSNLISGNGCCCEFLVDTSSLNDDVKYHGDVSYLHNGWDGNVKDITVYDSNYFDNWECN